MNDLDAQGPPPVPEPAEEQVKPKLPPAQRQTNGLDWLVKQAQRNRSPRPSQAE